MKNFKSKRFTLVCVLLFIVSAVISIAIFKDMESAVVAGIGVIGVVITGYNWNETTRPTK